MGYSAGNGSAHQNVIDLCSDQDCNEGPEDAQIDCRSWQTTHPTNAFSSAPLHAGLWLQDYPGASAPRLTCWSHCHPWIFPDRQDMAFQYPRDLKSIPRSSLPRRRSTARVAAVNIAVTWCGPAYYVVRHREPFIICDRQLSIPSTMSFSLIGAALSQKATSLSKTAYAPAANPPVILDLPFEAD